MRVTKVSPIALLLFVPTTAYAQPAARNANIERVQSATTILNQIMQAPDKGIPDSIMSGAKCIVILPPLLMISFRFDGNYAKVPGTCPAASGWSAPALFR